MKSNSRPDIDITEELGEDKSSYYQSLIGVLRWIVEIGRVDICCEVSMLSSHLALPRCGHLAQVLHMFAYLKYHANSEMVYEPSGVEFDRAQFLRKYWGIYHLRVRMRFQLSKHMQDLGKVNTSR